MKKRSILNKEAVLLKNPEAAEIWKRYQDFLKGMPDVSTSYRLGVPYQKPKLQTSSGTEDFSD